MTKGKHVDTKTRAKIVTMLGEGIKHVAIAERLGISPTTVSRIRKHTRLSTFMHKQAAHIGKEWDKENTLLKARLYDLLQETGRV